jgi:hypothetical protein
MDFNNKSHATTPPAYEMIGLSLTLFDLCRKCLHKYRVNNMLLPRGGISAAYQGVITMSGYDMLLPPLKQLYQLFRA